MGSHRQLRALVKAHVGGHIDFSKAEIGTSKWDLHVQLITNELMRQEYLDFLRTRAMREAIHISSPFNTEETLKQHFKAEEKFFEEWVNTKFDLDPKRDAERLNLAEATRQAWEKEYGKISDADTQQKIAEAAAVLRARREATRRGDI